VIDNRRGLLRPSHWAKPLEDAPVDTTVFQLNDDVYRGSQPFHNHETRGFFRERKIQTIINLRTANEEHENNEMKDEHWLDVLSSVKKTVHLELNPNTITPANLVKFLETIAACKKPVYIHCRQGIERTGVMCAAYRIVFENWTPEEAIAEMSEGYGFRECLPKLAKLIRSVNWDDMRDMVRSKSTVLLHLDEIYKTLNTADESVQNFINGVEQLSDILADNQVKQSLAADPDLRARFHEKYQACHRGIVKMFFDPHTRLAITIALMEKGNNFDWKEFVEKKVEPLFRLNEPFRPSAWAKPVPNPPPEAISLGRRSKKPIQRVGPLAPPPADAAVFQLNKDVYRGSQPSNDPDSIEFFRLLGIQTVVNLRAAHEEGMNEMRDQDWRGAHVQAIEHLELYPHAIAQEDIATFIKTIAASKKPVFVHCQAGIERTGVMCAAYRIVFENWTPDEAIAEMTAGYGSRKYLPDLAMLIRSVNWDDMRDVTRSKSTVLHDLDAIRKTLDSPDASHQNFRVGVERLNAILADNRVKQSLAADPDLRARFHEKYQACHRSIVDMFLNQHTQNEIKNALTRSDNHFSWGIFLSNQVDPLFRLTAPFRPDTWAIPVLDAPPNCTLYDMGPTANGRRFFRGDISWSQDTLAKLYKLGIRTICCIGDDFIRLARSNMYVRQLSLEPSDDECKKVEPVGIVTRPKAEVRVEKMNAALNTLLEESQQGPVLICSASVVDATVRAIGAACRMRFYNFEESDALAEMTQGYGNTQGLEGAMNLLRRWTNTKTTA